MVNAFLESLLPRPARDPRLEATTTTTTDAVLETCRLEDPRALEAAGVARGPGSRRPTSRSPRRNETRSSRTRAVAPPRRVSRASGGGCFPAGLTTRVTTRVVPAPGAARSPRASPSPTPPRRRSTRCSNARVWRTGSPAGPRSRQRRRGRSARRRSGRRRRLPRPTPRPSPPPPVARAAPAATASLTTRDLGRVAAVLGVRPRDVPTALLDGSKPYLPARSSLSWAKPECASLPTNESRETKRPSRRRRESGAGRARTKNEPSEMAERRPRI